MLSFPTSRLAHNLALPVLFSIFTVACLAAYEAEAARLGLPQISHNAGLTPLGLSGSALSLLLVFRTNASYQRYVEGRSIWGGIVNTSRNMVRKSLLYFPAGEDSQKRAIARWTVALAHCTRLHMREASLASVATARPPLEPAELAALSASAHRPNFCLQMLGKLVSHNVADRFTALSLDEALTHMEDAVGGVERLYRTPIPLSYTRHTSRLLLVWLLYLPVALFCEYGFAEALLISPLLIIALFGIEEIGVELEEPGGILPIVALCEAIEEQTLELLASEGKVTQLVLGCSPPSRLHGSRE